MELKKHPFSIFNSPPTRFEPSKPFLLSPKNQRKHNKQANKDTLCFILTQINIFIELLVNEVFSFERQSIGEIHLFVSLEEWYSQIIQKVSFEDSNQRYNGVVEEVKLNDMYDVMIDDFVKDRKVLEKNVSVERLESEDNYFFENENIIEELSGDTSKEEVSSFCGGLTVQELLKVWQFVSEEL